MKTPRDDWPIWQGKLYIMGDDIDQMTTDELRDVIRHIVPMVVETLPRIAEILFSPPPEKGSIQ